MGALSVLLLMSLSVSVAAYVPSNPGSCDWGPAFGQWGYIYCCPELDGLYCAQEIPIPWLPPGFGILKWIKVPYSGGTAM